MVFRIFRWRQCHQPQPGADIITNICEVYVCKVIDELSLWSNHGPYTKPNFNHWDYSLRVWFSFWLISMHRSSKLKHSRVSETWNLRLRPIYYVSNNWKALIFFFFFEFFLVHVCNLNNYSLFNTLDLGICRAKERQGIEPYPKIVIFVMWWVRMNDCCKKKRFKKRREWTKAVFLSPSSFGSLCNVFIWVP